MKFFILFYSILALSVSSAWAKPARTSSATSTTTTTSSTLSQKTHDVEIVQETHNYTRIDICEMAPNCEVYEDPKYGKLIRFVEGMGPGTAAYNKTVKDWSHKPTKVMARAASRSVLAILGENRINYGTVDPRDVMAGLWDSCQWGACSTSIKWYPTQSVRDHSDSGYYGSKPEWYSMILNPFNSRYGDWDQRNKMVSAIIDMVTQGLIMFKQDWVYSRWNPISGRYEIEDNGNLWVKVSGDYYSVTMFTEAGGPILGMMDVNVYSDYEKPSPAECGLIGSIKSALYGALNPLFGLAVTIQNYGACQ
ncbi:hypothetical protein H072_4732 [Dactylellina haptotyla CBS 200.50]|uniref:Ecp2 effector protein domain-containing protein n=1 Tax=Dactylellina haptotyla (strain CBS 200.50) TaxID=1284197 RepID=S8C1D6_DACHA|nr:hypothetical protein H072_4732 [Dactylellina haptotyla CBS 200.50]